MRDIPVSKQLVWRCNTWLSPQRQLCATHFVKPPMSRRPHRRGSAANPDGKQKWSPSGRQKFAKEVMHMAAKKKAAKKPAAKKAAKKSAKKR